MRVLFAAGSADLGYTEGKLWRLAKRLMDAGHTVTVHCDQESYAVGARQLGLPVVVHTIEGKPPEVEERMATAQQMIEECRDMVFPGTDLPLWRILALDDFVGSMLLYKGQPEGAIDADVIIMPLMGVDNNTLGACGLYSWIAALAQEQQIPMIGLEVSPIGNKNTMAYLPMSHYVVKSEWAKETLVAMQITTASQVSVLRWEEAYCCWPGIDNFTEATLEKEYEVKNILQIDPQDIIVLIPHHVAFTWEIRKILESLAMLNQEHLSIVIRVDSHVHRRQRNERDVVLASYEPEIKKLRHVVVVDERVGVGLLVGGCDVLISPFAGVSTERALLTRKPTIVLHAMIQRAQWGEYYVCTPSFTEMIQTLRQWISRGVAKRQRLAEVVALQSQQPPVMVDNDAVEQRTGVDYVSAS